MTATEQRTHRSVEWALRRPKAVMLFAALVTVVLALGAFKLEVDTDPENMLSGDEPVRVRNDELREQIGTGPLLAVGVVADDSAGIATVERVAAVAGLHRRIAELDGVVSGGVVSFLTAVGDRAAPSSGAEVTATIDAVAAHPLMGGDVVSEDGTTAAIFVPLHNKSDANAVAAGIDTAVDGLAALSDLDVHTAGLPLAEAAFGQEMFRQMAIFAPLAGLLVFAVMLWFLRRVSLVASAMAWRCWQ